jgi:hypothetical protein
MALLRSGVQCGGHSRRFVRLQSSRAQRGAVQEEGQREHQRRQAVAGPVHQFMLSLPLSLYNGEVVLLRLPTARARRRPLFVSQGVVSR